MTSRLRHDFLTDARPDQASGHFAAADRRNLNSALPADLLSVLAKAV